MLRKNIVGCDAVTMVIILIIMVASSLHDYSLHTSIQSKTDDEFQHRFPYKLNNNILSCSPLCSLTHTHTPADEWLLTCLLNCIYLPRSWCIIQCHICIITHMPYTHDSLHLLLHTTCSLVYYAIKYVSWQVELVGFVANPFIKETHVRNPNENESVM